MVAARQKSPDRGSNGYKHDDLDYDTVRQSEENIRVMMAEVERLKLEKQRAVVEEEFEEAAMLKRRIKVLEDSIGENNKTIDMINDAKARAKNSFEKSQQKGKEKPKSQLEHGENLIPTDDPTKKRLVSDEIEFIQKQRLAMQERNVTDNTEQGVPKWAYDDIQEHGPTAVKTSRPSALSYQFKGMIEDEKWDEGVNFQHSFTVQVPVETAFQFLVHSTRDETPRIEGDDEIFPLGDGIWIQHLPSGIAQLFEPNEDALEENKTWVVRITVHKPRIPGKVKMEAARTVKTVEPFRKKPFYIFRKIWRLRPGPSGGTHITRIISDFKQFELLEFNALDAVSRQIEIDSEKMRMTWSTAVAVAPQKTLAVSGRARHDPVTTLARRMEESKEMYSATFEVDGDAESVFEALVSNELLDYCHGDFLSEKSCLRIDETQVLIRRTDGFVHLNRTSVSDLSFSVETYARQAGQTIKSALLLTTSQQVIAQYCYRVTNEWTFHKLSPTETSVRRVMKDFEQKRLHEELPDLANSLTEGADIENRKIIEYFRRQNTDGERIPRPVTAVSVRANYAMRPMPELLDHAAKNHVMEVREMLEIRGADPNYIHVRTDAWTVSDSRMEFYEEITPLVVAAERGACDVIKVLFNHPQLDVNLCCCAFSDLDIYNYYTAYDMTMTRKHPHAAALLRARGVLPASSEHVVKPEFDYVHMRPNRANANDTYGDDEYGAGEMPAWDSIAEGNPTLAKALANAANTLSMSKVQPLEVRQKLFKDLLANSHPDKHILSAPGLLDTATKVFQWLQTVKPWYLDENAEFGSVNMPLDDNPAPYDVARGRDHAQEVLHPSGSVYTVW